MPGINTVCRIAAEIGAQNDFDQGLLCEAFELHTALADKFIEPVDVADSNDPKIDPVGACVGMKGSRIHSIVRELQNENIDVINFTENMDLYISRSLSPAKITSIKVEEEEGSSLKNNDSSNDDGHDDDVDVVCFGSNHGDRCDEDEGAGDVSMHGDLRVEYTRMDCNFNATLKL